MSTIIRSICVVLVLVSILFATNSFGEKPLPDVNLTVATRCNENSAWGKEINVLTFSCFEGDCELITLVLNKCISLTDGKKIQTPFAFTNSTKGGSLHVQHVGNAFHVEIVSGPSGINRKYIFEFIPNSSDTGLVTKLKGFSGAYVKNSDILGKTITTELVPLHGAWQATELDCPMELPGIPEHDD